MIEKRDSFKNTFKILKLFWSSNSILNTSYFFLTLVQGLIPPAILYFLKKIVEVIEKGDLVVRNIIQSPIPDYLIICLCLAISTTLIKVLLEYLSEKQTYFLTKKIVPLIHDKSSNIDYEYYENSKFNDILHKSQEESVYRPKNIMAELFSLIQSVITFSAISFLIFSFNYKIGILLIVAFIPSMIARIRYSEKIFLLEKSQIEFTRRGFYYNRINTSPEFMKENRIFEASPFFKNKYLENLNSIYDKRLKIFKQKFFMEFFSRIVVDICFYGSLIFLIISIVNGEQDLSNLLLFYQGFQVGINNLQIIFNSLASLYEDGLYISSFFQFLDISPKIEVGTEKNIKENYSTMNISLKNVDFFYPNNPENMVLKNINIDIPDGKNVAFVGENGAGKTTLVKLISRLYDPSSGEILCNNKNIKDIDIFEYRRNISSIMQDFGRYEMTIRDNILLSAVENKEMMDNAIKNSGLTNLINKLPLGLDTKLGKTFSDGIEISMGQWQKVALARALYRNTKLIILDEPTSSLDARSEREFYNNLIETTSKKTLVLITHRLSAIKLADYIYFIENGVIVEEGSHKELMNMKKKYYYLYNLQAKSFDLDI